MCARVHACVCVRARAHLIFICVPLIPGPMFDPGHVLTPRVFLYTQAHTRI